MAGKSDTLDRTFAALADPTRRAIVARLAHGETTVGALAQPFDMDLPAVSKHVKCLVDAGLVRRERRGRFSYCRLNGRPLQQARDWMTHHEALWNAQLAQLEAFLAASRES